MSLPLAWCTPPLTAFLEPQHSRPRPRGQHNLLVSGLCGYDKRNCEPHQHCDFAYPDQAHRGSRTHAIQPYLPEPNRGTNLGHLSALSFYPLSPLSQPGDWVKQSIPFSYLSLTAESLDGAAHAVQVQTYVSAGA